ncbi:(4Fe-4S)-binding protein [Dyadobacter tibetensis]|uniref:(4Fe-4S)-binding protein n=1 Tax=Dyadobacter tibetensis TaxID=1211851 RepID=UPI00047254B3|nr:(4Fe-4S)-binding protein [Dyadobacter tibetensis]
MAEIIKEYSNGEVTIVWKPALCIHSRICWQNSDSLPEVFNPSEKPWIKPHGAPTTRIMEQVKRCPSGALSYFLNPDKEATSLSTSQSENARVEILPNGPLLVHGTINLKDKSGEVSEKAGVTAFCRCGQSANKPFCDGSHLATQFQDA